MCQLQSPASCCAFSASQFPPSHIQHSSSQAGSFKPFILLIWLLLRLLTSSYITNIRPFTQDLYSQKCFHAFLSYFTDFQFPLVTACICHSCGLFMLQCSCSLSFLYNLPWLYLAFLVLWADIYSKILMSSS